MWDIYMSLTIRCELYGEGAYVHCPVSDRIGGLILISKYDRIVLQ
jgi:hypothetical protein